MTRLLAPLLAFALLAAACGSNSVDALTDLGLTDEQAKCFTSEYESRGLAIDSILASADNSDLTDEELGAAAEVARLCTGATNDDTTNETTNTDTSGSDDSGSNELGLAPDYQSLDMMERFFVDSIAEQSGDQAAGLCIIGQFREADINLFDLAAAGAEGSDPTGELTSTLFDAMFRCGDELADSDLFSGDAFGDGGFFSGGQGDAADGSEYGDNAELDALWDQCDQGDGAACDELYWTSPSGSAYESFGNTCGNRMDSAPFSCADGQSASADPVGAYGEDPTLDTLYDECSLGDYGACDTLYWDAPLGSQYEAYGSTCANVVEAGTYGNCLTTLS